MKPGDSAGAETLDIMSLAPRYARWQVDVVSEYIGNRVCEVGSGIGNIAAALAARSPGLLLLTDMDPYYRDKLTRLYNGSVGVEVRPLTLPDVDIEAFRRFALDTVIAFNVIEHIDDDVASVAALGRIVAPGGYVIVLVPAMTALFGTLDQALQHRRRYEKASAAQLIRGAGLELVELRYFNLVGAVGWWVASRIRGQRRLPKGQVALFDRTVPVLRQERWIGPPLGLSLIAIGRRPK